MNPDLKLLKIYDKIDGRIRLLEDLIKEVEKQEGPRGEKGDKGEPGRPGLDGKHGVDGAKGKDGLDGKDGADGKDGVSVVDATVDMDGHLVLTLSNGELIDAGEVVPDNLSTGEGVTAVYSGGRQPGTPTFIQDTQPNHNGPYFWIQTNYCGDDCCMTFWVEDGK